MREFVLLISQLSVIALLQTVLTVLMKKEENLKDHIWIIQTACIMGSLFLLLRFLREHLFAEVAVFLPILY